MDNDLPVIDFQGGLGDCILRIYRSNNLRYIDEGNPCNIICYPASPSVKELFYWHPHAKKFNLFDAHPLRQFMGKGKDMVTGPELRRFIYDHYGFSLKDRVFKKEEYMPPQFFHRKPVPSGESPYVVIQLEAGGYDRNIPRNFYKRILHSFLPWRNVYIVARDRHFNFDFRQPDNVTVIQWPTPAVLELVRNCTLFVGTHSSLLQAAWLEDKPSIVLYPDNHPDYHGPPEFRGLKYSWGKDKDNTLAIDFSTFDENGFPYLPHE